MPEITLRNVKQMRVRKRKLTSASWKKKRQQWGEYEAHWEQCDKGISHLLLILLLAYDFYNCFKINQLSKSQVPFSPVVLP